LPFSFSFCLCKATNLDYQKKADIDEHLVLIPHTTLHTAGNGPQTSSLRDNLLPEQEGRQSVRRTTEDAPSVNAPSSGAPEGHARRESQALTDALHAASKHEIQYKKLRGATGNFAAEHVLGEGSFARVFMGCLAGKKVAVKVDKHLDEGEEDESAAEMIKALEQQFVAELKCLYQYRHPNICALLHHSTDGPTRCLVYEYCANGALWGNIHPLTWPQRRRVAVGVARGLAYLHSATPDPIVHRDVKSMNILLDENMGAKVSRLQV
jgi:hypothetical protein